MHILILWIIFSDIVNLQVVGLNRKRNSKSLQDDHGPEVSHFYLDTGFMKTDQHPYASHL